MADLFGPSCLNKAGFKHFLSCPNSMTFHEIFPFSTLSLSEVFKTILALIFGVRQNARRLTCLKSVFKANCSVTRLYFILFLF